MCYRGWTIARSGPPAVGTVGLGRTFDRGPVAPMYTACFLLERQCHLLPGPGPHEPRHDRLARDACADRQSSGLIVRGSLMYLLILAGFRVFRRDAGSLSVSDLLVVVLIADAAQNGMAGDRSR